MSNAAVAQRYAQAIFDLGVETSSLTGLVEDFRKLVQAYASSPELRAFAANPLIPEASQLAAIQELSTRLGLSALSKNAIGLITRRRRLTVLPDIFRELERMQDQRAGISRVIVTSAQPLSETYATRLQRELEAYTGKRVVMERRQDPELLAGVVVKIGDRVIDGTARARLNELRTQLLSA